MDQDKKKWIDNASYSQLFQKWRFDPIGSPWFQGEIGEYYSKIMEEKFNQEDHVKASKEIGFRSR